MLINECFVYYASADWFNQPDVRFGLQASNLQINKYILNELWGE